MNYPLIFIAVYFIIMNIRVPSGGNPALDGFPKADAHLLAGVRGNALGRVGHEGIGQALLQHLRDVYKRQPWSWRYLRFHIAEDGHVQPGQARLHPQGALAQPGEQLPGLQQSELRGNVGNAVQGQGGAAVAPGVAQAVRQAAAGLRPASWRAWGSSSQLSGTRSP